MDQKQLEVEQTASNLPGGHKSCSESFTPTKKPHVHEISHFDTSLVSPTPEKTEETVNFQYKLEPATLPEKYRLLSELFDGMTTALRLLNLRKQLPIFQNICRIVEILTERKFSYKNLAQIKFILPEAIQTNKILVHNKKTSCMEPDLKVTLLFDVVEGHAEHSDYLALSREMSSRLFKYLGSPSEDSDVPEAELPEPFNRKEIRVSANSIPLNSSIQAPPNLDESEPLIPSLLPPSFKRHFSKKEIEKPIKTEVSLSPVPPSSIDETDFSTCLDAVKQEKALQVADEYTPMKKPLVNNEIDILTPDLSTPKRSVTTEDNKPKSMVNLKVMTSNLIAKRTLDFSNFDEESELLEGSTTSNSEHSAKINKELDSKLITEMTL